jgi:hypothetical protein
LSIWSNRYPKEWRWKRGRDCGIGRQNFDEVRKTVVRKQRAEDRGQKTEAEVMDCGRFTKKSWMFNVRRSSFKTTLFCNFVAELLRIFFLKRLKVLLLF